MQAGPKRIRPTTREELRQGSLTRSPWKLNQREALRNAIQNPETFSLAPFGQVET